MAKTITIFTPVYNRREEIRRLYESLKRQTSNNFIWLIVDDGSTDDVLSDLKQWQSENKIRMQFVTQPNGGKHRAHNKGVELCDTPWFICVDSDDYLADDAVESMASEINMLQKDDIGVIFAKFNTDSDKPRQWFANGERVNVSDIALRFGHIIETVLLFKTSLLKENLFPEISGEKFMGEEILYNVLQKYGKLKASDKIVYYFSYLDGGITKNTFKIWKANPVGVLMLLNSRYETIKKADTGFWNKELALIKCVMNINAICMTTGKKIGGNTPDKYRSYALYLPSIFFEKKRYGSN